VQLECQSEECLESSIQDILKEAQKTLREFTKSMNFTNLNFDDRSGLRSQEAKEVLLVHWDTLVKKVHQEVTYRGH